MIKFLKTETTEENNNGNIVSVIDKHLVLSLTKTEEPIIWRMSLDDIGTAVFSIKKGKEKSTLILKQKDGKEEIIATFAEPEEAAKILSSISHCLLNPKKSKIALTLQNNQNNKKQNDNSEKRNWGIALILVIIIIGLYLYLMSLMPENIITQNQSNTNTETEQRTTGQPLDADEFLKGL